MLIVREIARILVSITLLVFCGFLYWCGFKSPEVAEKLGMTNTASLIIGASLTYWFRPASNNIGSNNGNCSNSGD